MTTPSRHSPGSSRLRITYYVLRITLISALIGGGAWSLAATRAGVAWRAGRELLAARHYGAAAAALAEAINHAPPGDGPGYRAAWAQVSLSEAYLAQRDGVRAAAVLPGVDGGDPALGRAVALQRGVVALAAGDAATARDALDRAVALPLTAGADAALQRAALWHRGETLWRAGDPHAAADFAALTRGAPPADPYTVAAWLRQAADAARDNPAAAGTALAAARAALPVRAPAGRSDLHLTDLGLDEGLPPAVISDTLPRLEAALRGVAAVQGAGPAALDVYWGRTLVSLEAWPQAAALLRRALAADPSPGDVYAYLGLCLERSGDPPAAETAYRTAVRLAPTHDLGRHLLARLLTAQRRWAEARPLLDALLANDVTDPVVHLDLAGWAQASGDYALAEREYVTAEQAQIARAQAGTAGVAEQALDTPLLLAQFYFVAGGTVGRLCPPAVAPARRAVARRPGAAEYDALGWAHYLCGDAPSALAALTQAVALDPLLPAAQYHLGVILDALGDPAARAHLTAARDLDPGGVWDRRALSVLALAVTP